MSIKKGAKELTEIAARIAKENNVDLTDISQTNKSKLNEVWSKATKEFDAKYKI